MDDSRARYLRQQAELGGREVYLSEPAAIEAPVGGAERQPGAREGRQDGSTAASAESANAVIPPSKRYDPLPAGASKWSKNPPPIPGPGLTVMPPGGELLADAIESLGSLDAVAAMISGCRKCMLCEGRTHTVPGEGNPQARLMCVGEGPGATEDETGRPFVGAAGQLLNRMLAAIDCPRETVFIANIVKCRPPQNRKPLPDEAAACLPYLHRQIALLRPTVLLALGGTAAEHLLGVKSSLGGLRGKVHSYGGIPVVVTYHPAALLRNPNWKKPTWDDVRVARQLLDR
ncbi:MAG: uracil-DNA glycosylase [Gemmatimonadota bacterium]